MFEKGLLVRIVSTDHTDNLYGMNPSMQQLFEEGRPVRLDSYDRMGKCVRIEGCYWHPKDIRSLDFVEDKNPQIFHFDEKHLDDWSVS